MAIYLIPEDVAALATLIGTSADGWRHNCHVASVAIVESGLYPGARVARGSCTGVTGQHSWVALGDPYAPSTQIIDATLWSYDRSVRGLWKGTMKDGRHVPHGFGSIWDYGRPPSPTEKPIELTPKTPLSNEARRFLVLCGPLDRRGWMDLANAPVGGWPAAEIIAAMDDTDALTALVPIDRLGMLTDRNPGGLYLKEDHR